MNLIPKKLIKKIKKRNLKKKLKKIPFFVAIDFSIRN